MGEHGAVYGLPALTAAIGLRVRVELDHGAVYEGTCDGATLEIWGITVGKAVVAGTEFAAVQFYYCLQRLPSFP